MLLLLLLWLLCFDCFVLSSTFCTQCCIHIQWNEMHPTSFKTAKSLRSTLKSLGHFCDVITRRSQHAYGSIRIMLTGCAHRHSLSKRKKNKKRATNWKKALHVGFSCFQPFLSLAGRKKAFWTKTSDTSPLDSKLFLHFSRTFFFLCITNSNDIYHSRCEFKLQFFFGVMCLR